MGIVFHYYYYNDYMFELYDFQCVQCMFSKAILDDLLPHQIKYCLFWQNIFYKLVEITILIKCKPNIVINIQKLTNKGILLNNDGKIKVNNKKNTFTVMPDAFPKSNYTKKKSALFCLFVYISDKKPKTYFELGQKVIQ